MTLSAPRAHGLDTLRSLAILSVMLFHVNDFHGEGTLPAFLIPVAQLGWMGVDLFFVLSGYLIAAQFLHPYRAAVRPRLWPFYRNRLFRILPAYFAVLALYLAVPVWREDAGLPPLWQMVTFTQNLFVNYASDRAFSHVWSLCVEEHFYLLFPLLVYALMRRPSLRKTLVLLAGLVLFGICFRAFVLVHTLRPLAASGHRIGLVHIERIFYPTYSRLDGLLAGVTLALIKTFRPEWWRAMTRRGHRLLCLGLCLVALAIYVFKDRWDSVTGVSAVGVVIGFPVLALGLGLLVASAVSTNGWLRLKIPGAELIATLAYSIYLTHKELIHLVDLRFPALAHGSMFQWLALYALTSFVVAMALHLAAERPFLILRDKPFMAG
ncbi:MAG TPA: acyltransferase [Terracidiphilus sp.]|nr:acyltransferase [Terracidiphilus sp.]